VAFDELQRDDGGEGLTIGTRPRPAMGLGEDAAKVAIAGGVFDEEREVERRAAR
jgi:hypothetical protein